jgi:nucleoside-diphosphate kinase
VAKWRETMGATNPANAAEGTIRKRFAESVGRNCAHGSDSKENAAIELAYFFAGNTLA